MSSLTDEMTTQGTRDQLLVTVNGEERAFPPGLTIAGMLALLGLSRGKVAVECREVIVPRSHYETLTISAGDRFEIVHFIGGG